MWTRLGGSVLVAVPVVIAMANPASAHVCTVAAPIPVGRPTSITVGITVEDIPANDIFVVIPKGVEVDAVASTKGWTATHEPTDIRFRGGPFPAHSCGHFSITVKATNKGVFRLPVLQRMPDGSLAQFPSGNDIFIMPNGQSVQPDHSGPPNPLFEQVVYAGVPVGTTSVTSSGKGGIPWLVIFGGVDVALVALLLLPYLVRRKRRRTNSSCVR
jgi:hypothetical protein